ncbi:hypothetical protein ABQE57_00865 [Mycolicibacterium elephantis]|uniref:linalool dehydratase/isomerase domain-containing protein n=1 Tax=Mycolicibacterium elephantis TaxID=81858 RepID=UPI0007EB2892|nr:hypothetical protein [Mycolicibacterium elephantis]OBB16353.1 hypothetical protein A5762_03660 [Mycolicibacterium elephantis]OBE95297.1 hypothetical protein A5776_02100 [Mycolicibacterium elephantis]
MTVSAVEPEHHTDVGYTLIVPDKPNGPIVRSLLRRTTISAALTGGAAALVAVLSKRPDHRATALGALIPGGGYIYTRSPVRFLATLGGFAASLVAWFGSGNIVAPPLVWLAAARNARGQARRGHKTWEGARFALPAMLATSVAVGTVARRRAFRAAQRRGRERAGYLATVPRIDPRPRDSVRGELSTDDLATMRSMIDRALQPLDRFDGFTKVDQFQPAAIRYQLNFLQYALAMSQLHGAPSFHGYLSAAQRNLIDKLTLPPVWRYWAYEQTWGNFSLDWDPMKRDNIMLSGYLGMMLGIYESNTADDRYRHHGALPFRLGRRTWPYNHDMVSAAVHDNMARSKMVLFPCEPNWVYSACNMTGINTLMLSDRLHGTRYIESVGNKFRRALHEEFITPDGRVTAIRSARLGVTIPMLTSTIADSGLATMLHAFDSDLAQRCWTIVRREFVETSGAEPSIALRGWDAIDTGNYKRSQVASFVPVMWGAAEMGDTELFDLLAASLDRQCPPTEHDGARWYDELSTNMNAMLAVARFSPPGGFRALIADGPGEATRSGPVLADAAYPDVLVASARTDGTDLRMVLRPGAGPTRTDLDIQRLVPNGQYRLRGAVDDLVTADDHGHATVTVDLAGRTEISLVPAV